MADASSFVDFPPAPGLSRPSVRPFHPESFFLRFQPPLVRHHHGGFENRSIAPARLSTHIFDCSTNMPKFIPRPSTSSTTTTTTVVCRTTTRASLQARSLARLRAHVFPRAVVQTSSFKRRRSDDDEFVRRERRAQSNSILLRLRCNSSYERYTRSFRSISESR